MRLIPYRTITVHGKHGGVAYVDDRDYDRVRKFRWYGLKAGYTKYAYRTVCINSTGSHAHRKRTSVYMHCFILGVKGVDHHNRNGLDNRRSNLRLASQSQNMANKCRRSDNKSGVKGVWWQESRKKWTAQIKVGGRARHLGRFDSKEEAGEAYIVAAKSQWGEFARAE